jgi:DNA gyrase/topoisomerase IV subunit A
MVLVNGPKGIATGFATDIMPRHPKDVAKACREYMNKSRISKRVPVTFPSFKGTVDEVDGKFVCRGVFEKKGKTVLLISEVPYGFNRESYVKVLDKLEEKNDIVSYDDLCDSQGFRFEVKLKQNTSANWDDARIIKEFSLEKTFTENLTVIDQRGKLKVYEDERDLIKDFCDYRIGILQDRIKLRIKEHDEEIRWLQVKMQFIKAVLDGDIVFKGKKKQEVEESIFNNTDAFGSDADRLLRMNIVSLTSEMVNELKEAIEKAEQSLRYWKETTPNIQFIEDLKEL